MSPDQDQFIGQLYQQYFDDLILYAIASLKNESRAQDIVQDAFHEAILRADVLMQHDNPKGWLMLTVKHKIREYQRELQKYMKYFISLDNDLLIEPGKEEPTHTKRNRSSVDSGRVSHFETLDHRPGQSPRSCKGAWNFDLCQSKAPRTDPQEAESAFFKKTFTKFLKFMSGPHFFVIYKRGGS